MEKVSVVIPAYNSARHIGRVLKALREQDYGRYEVIVVDDCSGDSTTKEVRKFKWVKLIENKRNLGLSKSMNRGVKESSGEIIITLHDDCVPLSKNWMRKLVRTFRKDPRIGIVASEYVIDFEKLNLWGKCFSYAYWLGADRKFAKKEGVEETRLISDKCDAYKREVLEKIGLFDERFKFANEDTDISMKAHALGYKIVKNNECKVEHVLSESERERTVLDHFRKAFQITENQAYVFMKYGVGFKIDAAFFIISSIVGYFLPLYLIGMYLISIPLHKFFGFFGVIALAAVYLVRPELLSNNLLGAGIGITYLLAKNAFKSLRYFRYYGKVDLLIPITLFCFFWDLAAGLGWIRSILLYIKKELVP